MKTVRVAWQRADNYVRPKVKKAVDCWGWNRVAAVAAGVVLLIGWGSLATLPHVVPDWINPFAGARVAGTIDNLDPGKIPAEENHAWQPKELVAVIGKHQGPKIGQIAFASDGVTLVAGVGDIQVWDLSGSEPRQRHVLKGLPGGVRSFVLTDGGKMVAALSLKDQDIRLWDISGNEARQRAVLSPFKRPVDIRPVDQILFSPNGKTLAARGREEGVIRLWNVEQPDVPPIEIRTRKPTCMAFSPDSKTMAAGSEDWEVRVWTVTGPPRQRLGRMSHAGPVEGV
jgi:WD40 repeat protein